MTLLDPWNFAIELEPILSFVSKKKKKDEVRSSELSFSQIIDVLFEWAVISWLIDNRDFWFNEFIWIETWIIDFNLITKLIRIDLDYFGLTLHDFDCLWFQVSFIIIYFINQNSTWSSHQLFLIISEWRYLSFDLIELISLQSKFVHSWLLTRSDRLGGNSTGLNEISKG